MVLAKGAKFCCSVKNNQPTAFQALHFQAENHAKDALDHTISVEKQGSHVVRKITKVFRLWPAFKPRLWDCFSYFVQTRVERYEGNQVFVMLKYHALTHLLSASHAATLIREHWQIENRLHRKRDMLMLDDAWRGAPHPAILMSFAMNALAEHGNPLNKVVKEECAAGPDAILKYLKL